MKRVPQTHQFISRKEKKEQVAKEQVCIVCENKVHENIESNANKNNYYYEKSTTDASIYLSQREKKEQVVQEQVCTVGEQRRNSKMKPAKICDHATEILKLKSLSSIWKK